MKPVKIIPRIDEINNVDDFKVYCKFNTGEFKIIDFNKLFSLRQLKETDIEYPLCKFENFKKLSLINGTLAWNEIRILLLDENNNEKDFPLELDPVVLYQTSTFDYDKLFENIGFIVQSERAKAGYTQEQLAKRSGISKRAISKIENHKSDIGLLVVQKIMESGFGRKLRIRID